MSTSRHPKAIVGLFRRVLNSPAALWAVLGVPAIPLVADLIPRQRYYGEVMYETGLLSCQLLALTLAITPLTRLFQHYRPALRLLGWLAKRRRYFGVASFAYAMLHAAFYLRDSDDLYTIAVESLQGDFLAGWLAFAIMTVLALTSNGFSVHRLGKKWKPLQRTAYAVALLTMLHWLLIDQFLADLWTLALPLITLQIMRMVLSGIKRSYQLSSSSGN